MLKIRWIVALGVIISTMIVIKNSEIIKNHSHSTTTASSFIQTIDDPTCVGNYKDLPVFRLIVESIGGEVSRGSVFLVSDNIWVSADHVSPDDSDSITLLMPDDSEIPLTLDSRYAEIDAIILTGNSSGLTPIPFTDDKIDEKYLETQFWNIGYPALRGKDSILTTGNLLGYSDTYTFFKMLVLRGMSGGLTMICHEGEPRAAGIISSLSYEVLSNRRYINDDGNSVREIVESNTGESFSAPIHYLKDRVNTIGNETL